MNKRKARMLILVALILAGIGTFVFWSLFVKDRVSTDNAYVMAESATVSSRVPGNVNAIFVENDMKVEPGQLLLELDATDYEIQYKQALANVERLRAEIDAMKVDLELTSEGTSASLDGTKAGLMGSREQSERLSHLLAQLNEKKLALEAELELAQKEHVRVRNLYERGVLPKKAKDVADKNLTQAEAQLNGVKEEIKAAQKALSASLKDVERMEAMLKKSRSELKQTELKRERLKGLEAQLKEATARLEMAEQNLQYCKVKAPISGYIAQKRVQVGDRVTPGQPLLSVVPLEKVYVEANFKESQLKDIRIGQRAIVEPDAYPGLRLEGMVSGIRAGTGAAFSLLPPENATGNWIKVVQRVPVRIDFLTPFEKAKPLMVGFSLKVTVFTKDKTGPRLK